MRLSTDEKAPAEAAYARLKSHPQARGALMGVSVAFAINAHTFVPWLTNPHTSRWKIAGWSIFLGLVFGSCIMASILGSSRRKQDEKLVSFFEKHFPEECSWKQEEKILAEAKALDLKARVANLIHRQA